MKKIINCFILLITLILPIYGENLQIAEVNFLGLKNSKSNFILRYLTLTPSSEKYHEEILKLDLQKIENLRLFSKVKVIAITNIKNNRSKITLNYHLKEFWAAVPIFNFGVHYDGLFIKLGVKHRNLFGWKNELLATYQINNRHAFVLDLSVPNILKTKIGFSFELNKKTAFNTNSQNSSDGLDIWHGKSKMILTFLPWLSTRVGLGFDSDHYSTNISFRKHPLFNPNEEQIDHLFLLIGLNINKINYDKILLQGIKSDSFIKASFLGDMPVKLLVVNETIGYLSVLKSGTLTGRIRIGIATKSDTVRPPFVLDGGKNIRGVGEAVTIGTGEFTIGLEYRQAFFIHKGFALQPSIFIDYGTWIVPNSFYLNPLNWGVIDAAIGVGLRFYFRSMGNMVLRADVTLNLIKKGKVGFEFGLGQYY